MAEGTVHVNSIITPLDDVETRIGDWLPNYRIIIAIDFGTTNSGYAFSVRDQDTIQVNSYWGGQHLSYSKVPTCVLLDENKNFVSFGNEAQQAYTEMEEDEAKKHLFCDRFKTMLHSSDQTQPARGASVPAPPPSPPAAAASSPASASPPAPPSAPASVTEPAASAASRKELSRGLKFEAANGTKVSALRVFSEVLFAIWVNARDTISESTVGVENLEKKDIMWVITVPAIWTNKAKAFMREAAVTAGLVRAQGNNRMLFAFEPEAASIYCSQMSPDAFRGTPEVSQQQLNDQQIVIDAGGGTVDISVHEVGDSKGLHEIHSASGGPWGGHSINTAIWELLEDILGPGVLHTFKHDTPNAYVQQGIKIEGAKQTWKHDQGKGIRVELEGVFRDLIDEQVKGSLKDAIKDYADNTSEDVSYKGGYLHIGPDRTRVLFAKTVDTIVEHVETLLQHEKVSKERLRRIYLVGGFALCKYLQHRIREAFETDTLKVFIPKDASTIVVQGAVLFGKNPSVVKQRIAGFTYGMKCLQEFKEGHDPENKKLVAKEGGLWCKDKFLSLVKKGTPLEVYSSVRTSTTPTLRSQIGMWIPLYASSQEEVEYTTDESCTELGKINITFPQAYDNVEDGRCDVVLCFGLTEIHTLVIHRKSLKVVESKVSFLAD